MISKKAQLLLEKNEALNYAKDYEAIMRAHPDAIPMYVAENPMWYERYYSKISVDLDRVFAPWVATYGDMRGDTSTREFMSRVYSARLLSGLPAINPEHLVVQAGVSPSFAAALSCLTDPGDALLVHVPLYTGFIPRVERYLGVALIPVDLDAPDWASAYASHPRVRGIIICNPHNPTGKVFSESELRAAVRFAASRSLFVLSDEAYAMCAPGAFFSLARLMPEYPRVVVVWGLSKDFGLCGFRIGAAYTQDAVLLGALAGVAYFGAASQPAQGLALALLSDEAAREAARAAIDADLQEKRDELVRMKVPLYRVPQAGFFACLLLKGVQTWEQEREMKERLAREVRVLVTPGEAMRAPRPGIFRMCFAQITLKQMRDAMDRMKPLF